MQRATARHRVVVVDVVEHLGRGVYCTWHFRGHCKGWGRVGWGGGVFDSALNVD